MSHISQTGTATKPSSCFSVMPKLCHDHHYALLKLQEDAAEVEVDGNLFSLSPCTIFAHTDFCFGPDTPEKVAILVQHRNQGLKKMGWLHKQQLRLLMPIIGGQFSYTYLAKGIRDMSDEINQFTKKLRANGIWEH